MTYLRCALSNRFVLSLSVSILLGYSQMVLAWTRSAGFEEGELGTKAEASDGFDGAAGRSIYTSDVVYSGSQAAKLQVRKGNTGYGNFGGIINFPSQLKEGDEVWVRVSAYFPSSYQFFSPPQDNKFFRVRTNGPKEGTIYNNIYMTDERTRFIRAGDRWHGIRPGGPPRDTWETYELYLRFDEQSESEGGMGLVRFWIDGKLVSEFNDVPTLAEANAYAYALYVFTWWGNGGPPEDLHLYVDDIKITTEPRNVDEQGHRYIGLGDGAAPPDAPTLSQEK